MLNRLTFTTIYSVQESSRESTYLDLFLGAAESYLETWGIIVFDEATPFLTFKLPSFSESQTIFSLPFYVLDENIQDLRLGGKTYELEDFNPLYRLTIKPYPFKGLESKPQSRFDFHKGQGLEITAKWGFDKIPADIEFAFIEIFGEMLKNFLSQNSALQTGGAEITKSKVGDVETTFAYQGNGTNFSESFERVIKPIIMKYV